VTFSLYTAVVPSYLQILDGLCGLMDKAESFCSQQGMVPEQIIEARLAEDMHPFNYQVKSAAVHSLGAIEGVRRGVFSPDTSKPPQSFAALKARVVETHAGLSALEPGEVDGFIGRDMRFSFGERHIDYRAEEFLLSFSQPNFYFHATTAYDIMRWKGVQIGKPAGSSERRPAEAAVRPMIPADRPARFCRNGSEMRPGVRAARRGGAVCTARGSRRLWQELPHRRRDRQ
jgi:hypothetical protein